MTTHDGDDMARPTPMARWTVLLMLGLAGCQAAMDRNPRAESLGEAMRLAEAGDRLRRDGKLDDAADQYRRALAIKPDLAAAWNNLGVVLLKQGNRYDANQAFMRADELLPGDPRPLQNIGDSYADAAWDEQAIEYYLRSLERDPRWLPSIRGLALAALRTSSSTETIRDHLRTGMMVETDDAWREIIQRQQLRVEQDLAERARNRPGSPGAPGTPARSGTGVNLSGASAAGEAR